MFQYIAEYFDVDVREKGRDLTQSYAKIQHTNRKFQKRQSDNTKTPPKTSITQQLRTVLGRSVGLTTAIQLVWSNWLTGSKPFQQPQKQCYQKDVKFVYR